MKHRLPKDAFDYYARLGDERSYPAVAKQYGVSKRAVQKRATKEDWPGKIAEMTRVAREKNQQALQEDFNEMDLRHRKMVRAMASRAAVGLREFPLTNGMEAIKAAEVAIKLERLLAGEPGERTAHDVRDISRQEVQRLVTNTPVGTDGPDDW